MGARRDAADEATRSSSASCRRRSTVAGP
jgi:hypothetical protein